MSKINKSYRLDEKVVYYVMNLSKETGKSATSIIEDAVRAYDERKDKTPDESNTRDDGLYKLLEKQLAVKDEQIKELNRALLNAQTLQASTERRLEEKSQELKLLQEGPTESEVEVEADVEPIVKMTIWERLKRTLIG